MKKALIALVAVAVLAAAGFAVTGKETAPAAAFTSIEGKQTSVAQLQGKVVLVNFWATSCPGCIKEMPDLVKTHHAYAARGYETVAVAMSYDPPNYVKAYVEEHKLPFFITLDSTGQLAKSFGNVQLTPTSILLDKQGKVVKRFLGEPDFAELNQLIEKQLAA